MKKIVLTLSLLLAIRVLSFGQTTDDLLNKCISIAGSDTKYLKDFRIQMGKGTSQTGMRYKANMSLWKNMKYRFTMCCTDDSKGALVVCIKDETNKILVSSLDQKTGKTYSSVEFLCNKSGIYQLDYDFTDAQQGSGVGVVSLVK